MNSVDPYLSSRQLIVEVCQSLIQKGFLMGTGGNISVRVAGQEAMAITPSNYDYAQMTHEDVCILDLQASQIEGERKPSIESGMHAAIYKARSDVHVIIHTHQVIASAIALMGQAIPALFDEQVRFLGRSVEIVPYGASGTGWLKSNIVGKLKSSANAYILQNHGALTLGPNAERAIFNVELLEKCAVAYLLAYYTDERITRIPAPIREIIFAKLKKEQKLEAAR